MQERQPSRHRHLRTRLCGLALATAATPAQAETGELERPDPYRLLNRIGAAVSTVEQNYFEPVDHGELLEGALRGMVGELDPHSSYLSSDDLDIFRGDTEGEFGGIGVEVDFRNEEVVVIAPVEGSPAARAGVEPGDVIVALEGRPLSGVKPDELIRRMRGVVGTKLRLTLRKKATGRTLDLVLVRETITVSSILSATLNEGVGYLRIKSFQEGTHRDFLAALGKLRKGSPLTSLILDLRNNPGGLVREAQGVADEFLSGGVIYSTRQRGTVVRLAKASSSGAFTTGMLVVLINEFSASAAELVAGALKDHQRAILVGARSFGKGSVQTLLNLDGDSALKLTTAIYYTPNGSTLQARGILPHVRVDPGYMEDAKFRVIRESDLDGHIGEGREGEIDATRPPPTNDELHLGVARQVPRDPRAGSDLALAVAFRIASGELP